MRLIVRMLLEGDLTVYAVINFYAQQGFTPVAGGTSLDNNRVVTIVFTKCE